jgi:hypothetical protein
VGTRRRALRLAPALAALAVVVGGLTSVVLGAAGHDRSAGPVGAEVARPAVRTVVAPDLSDRYRPFSRSAMRVTASRVTLDALPKVHAHKYLTARLNLWPSPHELGRPLTVLPSGGTVAVTGTHRGGFAQIVRNGRVRWVNADYLVDHRPRPVPASSGSSDPSGSSGSTGSPLLSPAPCPSGSGMESGIVAAAVAVHRAVCAHFPQVHEYGGYRPDGEHADGHAIDIMVYADSGTGQAIADWVRANAAALHVDDVIWAQHIWTAQRSSEGWRLMPDRGSTTANHYDHVHVRVF